MRAAETRDQCHARTGHGGTVLNAGVGGFVLRRGSPKIGLGRPIGVESTTLIFLGCVGDVDDVVYRIGVKALLRRS